jgi:hypothetical protein
MTQDDATLVLALIVQLDMFIGKTIRAPQIAETPPAPVADSLLHHWCDVSTPDGNCESTNAAQNDVLVAMRNVNA